MEKLSLYRNTLADPPGLSDRNHSQLILTVSLALWSDPRNTEATRWLFSGHPVTHHPSDTHPGVLIRLTQHWSNPTMREQTNQPGCPGHSRRTINSNKEQLLVAKCYISFPHSETILFPPMRKLLDFAQLEPWFISFHSFLKFSSRRLRYVSLQKVNLQNSQRGTDLACKFFWIQHERLMGTRLLKDLLSAMKLKKLPQIPSFQSKSHRHGNRTNCPDVWVWMCLDLKILPVFWQIKLFLKIHSSMSIGYLVLNFLLCDFLLQKSTAILLVAYCQTSPTLSLHPSNSYHYAAFTAHLVVH